MVDVDDYNSDGPEPNYIQTTTAVEPAEEQRQTLSTDERLDRLEAIVRQHFGPHNMPYPEGEDPDSLAAQQAQTQADQAQRRGRLRPGPQV